MAEQELKVVIKAEDKATAEIKKVNASLSASGKAMQVGFSALKGAAMATVTGIAALGTASVAFGVSSVNAFIEAEAETERFNALMKTTGKGADEASKQLQAVADSTIDLGFDNESAALSLAKFYTSTKSVEEATRLNNIAMDIARAKNVDLDQAQKMVNMTLAGATRELKAMGIEVSENATGVQNLAKIEELYAGQSEAFAKTTAGKIQILQQRYGELKETVGATISEALTPFLEKMIEFSKSDEAKKMIENLTKAIGENLPKAIEVAKPILEGLWKLIVFGGKSIAFVVKVAQDFGTFLGESSVKAENAWTGFVAAIEKTYRKVVGWFNEVKESFKSITSLKFSFSSSKKEDGGGDSERATGGSVMTGKSYLVGENGPELFTPTNSGSIGNAAGGASTTTVNFNNVSVRNDSDLDAIIDAVKRTLNREQELTRLGAFV